MRESTGLKLEAVNQRPMNKHKLFNLLSLTSGYGNKGQLWPVITLPRCINCCLWFSFTSHRGAMDRCVCLLEMEPRTLNHEELHNARVHEFDGEYFEIWCLVLRSLMFSLILQEEAMELHNAWVHEFDGEYFEIWCLVLRSLMFSLILQEEAMAISQNKAPVETSNIFTQACEVQSLSNLDSVTWFLLWIWIELMSGLNLQDMKSVISAKGLDEKALDHKTDHVHELAQVKESWEISSVNSEDHFSTHPPKIKEPLSSPFWSAPHFYVVQIFLSSSWRIRYVLDKCIRHTKCVIFKILSCVRMSCLFYVTVFV